MTAPDERIELVCQCGRRLRAKSTLAGKRVRCPACGVVLEIPDDEPLVELEAVESPEESHAAQAADPMFDISGLLDEAEQDRNRVPAETTCPLCGKAKDSEERFCNICTAEQESAVRRTAVDELRLIDTGDGVLIDERFLVRGEELCWRGGSRQRHEIAGIDWEIEKRVHLSGVTQVLLVVCKLRDGTSDSVQVAVDLQSYQGGSIESMALSAAGSNLSAEQFRQALNRIGPVCAKLLLWLSGGEALLRRRSDIKMQVGHAHRVAPLAKADRDRAWSKWTQTFGLKFD